MARDAGRSGQHVLGSRFERRFPEAPRRTMCPAPPFSHGAAPIRFPEPDIVLGMPRFPCRTGLRGPSRRCLLTKHPKLPEPKVTLVLCRSGVPDDRIRVVRSGERDGEADDGRVGHGPCEVGGYSHDEVGSRQAHGIREEVRHGMRTRRAWPRARTRRSQDSASRPHGGPGCGRPHGLSARTAPTAPRLRQP